MKSMERVIEEQVQRWHVSTRKWEEPKQEPVITISRQPGSGGRVIAARLGQELGLDVFDREIIQGVADSAKMSAYVLETLDEKGLSVIDDWIATLVNKRHLWPDQYIQHLMKIVGTIGSHGRAVIAGRGANFILPPETTLRLRVIAPLETRIKNIMEEFSASMDDAKRRINRTASERRAFVRKYFNADIGDPVNYDLVLNTGNMRIDAAVDAVRAVLGKE